MVRKKTPLLTINLCRQKSFNIFEHFIRRIQNLLSEIYRRQSSSIDANINIFDLFIFMVRRNKVFRFGNTSYQINTWSFYLLVAHFLYYFLILLEKVSQKGNVFQR